MEAMNEQKGDDESKQKMLEMLKKLEEQNREAQDDSETEDLEERLGDININSAEPEVVWSALTERERKEFESAVKSGEISNVVDIWEPWWSIGNESKSKRKVEEVSAENSASKETHDKPKEVRGNKRRQLPPVKRNIPSLTEILKSSAPNPIVQFSCIDVLFSYTYVMRLYNGCPEDTSEQAAESLLLLSPVLSQNAVFDSVESVVHNSLSVVQHSKDLYCSEDFSHLALHDVISLIKGHADSDGLSANFVECALSHVCRLLSRGREKLKVNSKIKQQDTDLYKSMWLAKKKAEFLLAWVHSNTNILDSLILSLQLVHAEVSASHKQHKEQTEKLEKAWGGSKPPPKTPLITEI